MSWFTTGFKEAERMAVQGNRKRTRNFWTKPGEAAVVRFLKPAKESFNYKRAFIPWAKGQKLYTSPGTLPDPLTEAGLVLQAAFAWPILDRRELEFTVEEDGKQVDKTIGPRVLFFADGQRTRKALIAFENEMRNEINEIRADEGLELYDESQYNLTSFDIKLVKEKQAPWQLFALRGGKPKELSDADLELIEKTKFDLAEELKPLPSSELRALTNHTEPTPTAAEDTYSYGDDEEGDTPSFFD